MGSQMVTVTVTKRQRQQSLFRGATRAACMQRLPSTERTNRRPQNPTNGLLLLLLMPENWHGS